MPSNANVSTNLNDELQTAEAPGKRNVCNCFQVTSEDMDRILAETGGADFATLKRYYQVGSRCTSCEYEIKDLITVYREERQQGQLAVAGARVPLGRQLGAWYRQLKLSILQRLEQRRFGIFVIRRPGFESSLVLSNLTFPEDSANANGNHVTCSASLYDQDGSLIARSESFDVGANQSRELWLHELFPGVTDDITGMMFVDYHTLRQVGSLRPYCCLNFSPRAGQYAGRWHYHDKYRGDRDYNGYYHCNHPIVAGQTCWLAISNCGTREYRSDVCLRLNGGRLLKREVNIPAHGSLWINVPEFFGIADADSAVETNSLLWLDNNQALMVWFFWRKLHDDIWLVQHH
jgi:bacterioferritin-associated ferredoxin